jgi:hypothetical protein
MPNECSNVASTLTRKNISEKKIDIKIDGFISLYNIMFVDYGAILGLTLALTDPYPLGPLKSIVDPHILMVPSTSNL